MIAAMQMAECVLGAPVWLDRLAPVAAPGSQEGSPPLLLRSPFVVAMMNRTTVLLILILVNWAQGFLPKALHVLFIL